jgi:RNA polymerase sigma-70 factor (ECF subfamily)
MERNTMTARVEDLLAESSWLEGLARALVGDREEARELVQEVWVRTLEERPEGVRQPRAWLARVLRNTLGMRRRAQGARGARERAAARPEATVGSGEVVARAESLRLLVDAVLALEEPLRSTVLWRYFDGLSSATIARRQGVPESTVRNRLAQALGDLRVRLGNSRSDWRASLGLIVWAEAARSALAPAVAVAATLFLCGLGSAWWVLRHSSSPESASASSLASADSLPSAIPTPTVLSSAREPLVANAPVGQGSPAAPTAPGVLEVEVLDDGEPCAHGGIFELAPDWFPLMNEEEPASWKRLTVVRPGCARIEGLSPGDYGVRYVSQAHAPLLSMERITEEAGARLVLLAGTSSFHGTVWDDSGLPMAGVELVLTVRSQPASSQAVTVLAFPDETCVRARTAADGSYSLSGLGAGEYSPLLVLSDKTELDLSHFSRWLAAGTAQQLDFGEPSTLPVWTGTLVSRSGAPHVGAATMRLFQGERLLLQRKTGPDGRFALGLEPGTYEVEVQLGRFDANEVRLGQVELTETGLQQDLVLPGTLLSGQVRFESGAPLPTDYKLELAVDPLDYKKPFARQCAFLDAEGRYAIDALEPGVYEFVAYPLEPAAAPLRIEIFATDLARSLDVVLRDF